MPRTRGDVALIVVGIAGGLVSGLLGVGGGVVMVPGLVLVAHLQQRHAHATSLAAIVPIGAVGAAVYATTEGIDYALAAVLAIGAVVGAPIGVRALSHLSATVLRLVYIAVAIPVGIRLVLG